MAVTGIARLASAANTNNSTLAQSGSVKVSFVSGYNAAAALRYIKLYDKATAPTVGTDIPKLVFTAAASGPFWFPLPEGVQFTLGLGYGLVTGAADSDNTAVTAADITNLQIGYA